MCAAALRGPGEEKGDRAQRTGRAMPTLATLPSQEPEVAVPRGRSPALRDRDSPLRRRGAPSPQACAAAQSPGSVSNTKDTKGPSAPKASQRTSGPVLPLHRPHPWLQGAGQGPYSHPNPAVGKKQALPIHPPLHTPLTGRTETVGRVGGNGQTEDRQRPGALSLSPPPTHPGVQTWSSVQGLQQPHQTTCHPTEAD